MHIGILKKELNNLKNISKSDVDYIFTKNFIEFKFLINKNNINRFNCIFLPIDAVLKALKL
jgi:hypothetical protein